MWSVFRVPCLSVSMLQPGLEGRTTMRSIHIVECIASSAFDFRACRMVMSSHSPQCFSIKISVSAPPIQRLWQGHAKLERVRSAPPSNRASLPELPSTLPVFRPDLSDLTSKFACRCTGWFYRLPLVPLRDRLPFLIRECTEVRGTGRALTHNLVGYFGSFLDAPVRRPCG